MADTVDRKTYIRRLPVPHRLGPEGQGFPLDFDRNALNAVVCPLFNASKARGCPQELILSAYWCLHSFMVNTDMIEAGYQPIFAVEWPVWNDYHFDFHVLGVVDQVVKFGVPPSDIDHTRIGKSIYAFLSDEMTERFDKILVLDSDLFACRKPNAPLYSFNNYGMTEEANPGGYTCNFPPTEGSYHQDHKEWIWYWWTKWEDMKDDVEASFDKMAERVNSFLPEDKHISRETQFPIVSGVSRFFMPKLADPEFINFLWHAEPLLGDEELLTFVWCRLTGAKLVSNFYDNVIFAGSVTDFYDIAKNYGDIFYMSHMVDDGTYGEWESTFQRQAGIV